MRFDTIWRKKKDEGMAFSLGEKVVRRRRIG